MLFGLKQQFCTTKCAYNRNSVNASIPIKW
jgi:hypothetical protein